jgi:hypothetical protein
MAFCQSEFGWTCGAVERIDERTYPSFLGCATLFVASVEEGNVGELKATCRPASCGI